MLASASCYKLPTLLCQSLILRMVQSAGGSATIGLGYRVVGDITESSDRGAYMGNFGIGAHVVPSIGPVIGGVLAREAGWR